MNHFTCLVTNTHISPIEVTSPGVVNLLTKLNVNKSTGPDGISPYILKETAHELSPLLTYLFNRYHIISYHIFI